MEPSAERLVATWPAQDLLDLLLAGLDLAEAVVSSVDDARRHAPTPCPDLDVEELVGHLVAGLAWFAGLPSGATAANPAGAEPELAGLPLGPAFAEAARAVRRSWTAQAVDRTFVMPWGLADGSEMASFMAVEVLAHAWDLSTGSGQPRYPVDDLAAVALDVAQELDEQTLRSPGMMAPPVPVDQTAPAIDRFVAFLGRDPHWRPAG